MKYDTKYFTAVLIYNAHSFPAKETANPSLHITYLHLLISSVFLSVTSSLFPLPSFPTFLPFTQISLSLSSLFFSSSLLLSSFFFPSGPYKFFSLSSSLSFTFSLSFPFVFFFSHYTPTHLLPSLRCLRTFPQTHAPPPVLLTLSHSLFLALISSLHPLFLLLHFTAPRGLNTSNLRNRGSHEERFLSSSQRFCPQVT